jgi:hypothetical protein
MLAMMQANPSLVQAGERDTSSRYSAGDLASRVEAMRLGSASGSAHDTHAYPNGHHPTSLNGATTDSPFTYIPPDPQTTYKDLLSRCLDWDLEILKTLPEEEDVSLGILSPDHVHLLGECALRWRLPPSFRAWVFLDAITERCELGLVPSACVHEATGMVGKVSEENPVGEWAIPDVSHAFWVLGVGNLGLGGAKGSGKERERARGRVDRAR